MKITYAAALLLITGCTHPAERVTVAPALAVSGVAKPAATARNPLVGGADLPPDRLLAANLAGAPVLSTLTRLANASGLADALATGPVTLFAPTDEAFGRLAPGTVEALSKPDNRAALGKLVSLHLVAGRLSSVDLVRKITAARGRATLTTIGGESLSLSLTGNVVTLADAGGNRSFVETADVRARNGIMHVVNGVLVPRLP